MAGPTETEAEPAERHVRGRRAPDGPAVAPPDPEVVRRLRLPGRRTLLAAGALALVLGAFGLWALYGSSWFRVERVSVAGVRVLTESRVRAAAGVPLGDPLVSVDRGAVERRVRERLSRVADVRVVRAWPHGVGIQVTERRPVLLVPKGGGDAAEGRRFVEVDADGVRFATVEHAPRGVPLLVLEPAGHADPRWTSRARLRRAAADVVTALPEPVRRGARTVRVRSYDEVTVELASGRTVRWGSPEHGAEKAEALTAMTKAADDASHFDVSAPGAPAASGG